MSTKTMYESESSLGDAECHLLGGKPRPKLQSDSFIHTRRANTPNRKITERMAVIRKISNFQCWAQGNPCALCMHCKCIGRSMKVSKTSKTLTIGLLYDKLSHPSELMQGLQVSIHINVCCSRIQSSLATGPTQVSINRGRDKDRATFTWRFLSPNKE